MGITTNEEMLAGNEDADANDPGVNVKDFSC